MDYVAIGVKSNYFTLSEDLSTIHYISQGKTYNYLDPEEKIRAAFYVELIEKYQYKPERILFEFQVPRRTPSDFADIVVFSDNKNTMPFIVVECKKEGITKSEEKQAIEQAFGNANSIKAKYTSLIAGNIRICFDVNGYPPTERKQNIIADLPISYGKPQELKYIKSDPKWDLTQATTAQLISVFNQCHDIIWEGGKNNPAEAFDEMSKLMFCKVRDERETRKESFYSFQIKTHEDEKNVSKRIKEIYKNAKIKDPDIFKNDISLSDEVIYNIVTILQSISLSKSDIDAKGRAFETFMGKIFRGDLGQYFTPREIVKFMVHMVQPKIKDIIIDPACGSGGFLLNSLDFVRQELYESLDKEEAYKEEVDFVRYNLFGIEINQQIARVAMMDMILHDDGHTNIEAADGLDSFENYDPKKAIKPEKFTVVLTNPPFGFSVERKKKDYFEDYDLAEGKNNLSSQIMFIERSYKLLSENGILGIVVPDSITTNSTTQYVRDYIFSKFQILAVISLPKQTFMPSGTGVKTSLLFLRKKTRKEINNEIAEINRIKLDLSKKYSTKIKEEISKVNSNTKTGKSKINKIESKYDKIVHAEAWGIYNSKFSYPVFMAVAKHVGYDATGKPDINDLYSFDEHGNVVRTSGILGEYLKFKSDPFNYKTSDVLKIIGAAHE